MDGTQLLLVTGFLGAGKTTALRGLLRVLRGRRVHVIVNEFGRVGYDGAMLRDLAACLSEIDGGSIFCACRLNQFEQALRDALLQAPEWILVESSGLSDPTAIRAIVERPHAFEGLIYRGCIALADATRLYKVLDTMRAARRQLSVSDLILLSKTDIATPEQVALSQAALHESYPLIPVELIVGGEFLLKWLAELAPTHAAIEESAARDLSLQRRLLLIAPCASTAQLTAFLRFFAEDTCRVKGVVALAQGRFRVDCVGAHIEVSQDFTQTPALGLVVLAGEGQNLRARLREARYLYPEIVREMSE
ncbi:MAG: GTP-binding protein [Clostridia bacterium]